MGSARAPPGSPSHSETGHLARAGRVRPGRVGGCGVRAAPHRHSPQPPPRPGAGQGGIPGRRSNRHPAAAPEPADRTGNGSPDGHHPPGEGCSGTRWGRTAPRNPPARRCLPPDIQATYMAMAKGEDDLKRRRKNKAGQLKAAPLH